MGAFNQDIVITRQGVGRLVWFHGWYVTFGVLLQAASDVEVSFFYRIRTLKVKPKLENIGIGSKRATDFRATWPEIMCRTATVFCIWF